MKFNYLLTELSKGEVVSKNSIEEDIAATATTFARYAMADVEYAAAVLGTTLTKDEYERCFRAMIVRKAKNEIRKYNAKQ